MQTSGGGSTWPNWRDDTQLLDYDGHEIRIIFSESLGGNREAPAAEAATFGDFNPTADDPDPDIWPLRPYDPGTVEDVDDLICITSSFPAPNVAWVTPEYLRTKYGHDPRKVEVRAKALPWHDRKGLPDDLVMDVSATPTPRMELTNDRKEALRRVANLWNGEVVQGYHLLASKFPTWRELTQDLDSGDVARLHVDPDIDQDLVDAFGEYSWLKQKESIFLRSQRLLKKSVSYDPTLRARTLINGHEDLPDLRGDPKEGLKHRVTVGLCAARYTERGWDVWTYYQYGDYVVDVVAQGPDDTVHFVEIITGHNNWELHRSTYEKFAELDPNGVPVAAFDTRETAYNVMSHWHREDLGTLPSGPFTSDLEIDRGRNKIQEAYVDSDDWVVADWFTTSWLWGETLGRHDQKTRFQKFISLKW